jgi:2-deoxy-D-gluconate 3-dehydrogenase
MSASSSQETPALPCLELFSFKGKNALITGGSRGVGAAIAVALAESGASICLAQRDISNDSTAQLIKSKGGRVEIIPCDLANAEDVKGIFQKAFDVMGREIHIMVNCEGLLKRKASVDVSDTDWDYVRSACSSFDSMKY